MKRAVIGSVAAGVLVVIGWAVWFGSEAPMPVPDGSVVHAIPKVDVHTHIALHRAPDAFRIFRRFGIVQALNASGGSPDGGGLAESIAVADASSGRLRPYCNVSFEGVDEPTFAERAVAEVAACAEAGAVGLKISKALGLGYTVDGGALLRVDDPRLDPIFVAAGQLGLPVLIHSGDPQAFFRPPTEDNERYAELEAHPSWSFFGPRPDTGEAWPSWEEVYAQFEARVLRHPDTIFVGAHFGNAPEEPQRVARLLEAHPLYVVETGARIPELGRHDSERLRRLFTRFQDRILFGTDLVVSDSGLTLGSRGRDPDPPSRLGPFFDAHWRFLETSDRNFAHPTPIQGEWTIDGINLEREVLEKLYWRNATRVFQLPTPPLPGDAANPHG